MSYQQWIDLAGKPYRDAAAGDPRDDEIARLQAQVAAWEKLHALSVALPSREADDSELPAIPVAAIRHLVATVNIATRQPRMDRPADAPTQRAVEQIEQWLRNRGAVKGEADDELARLRARLDELTDAAIVRAQRQCIALEALLAIRNNTALPNKPRQIAAQALAEIEAVKL